MPISPLSTGPFVFNRSLKNVTQHSSVSALCNSCRKRHKDRLKTEWKWLNEGELEKPEEFLRYKSIFVFILAVWTDNENTVLGPAR